MLQAYLLLCGVTVLSLILLLQGILNFVPLYGLMVVREFSKKKFDWVFLTLS